MLAARAVLRVVSIHPHDPFAILEIDSFLLSQDLGSSWVGGARLASNVNKSGYLHKLGKNRTVWPDGYQAGEKFMKPLRKKGWSGRKLLGLCRHAKDSSGFVKLLMPDSGELAAPDLDE